MAQLKDDDGGPQASGFVSFLFLDQRYVAFMFDVFEGGILNCRYPVLVCW